MIEATVAYIVGIIVYLYIYNKLLKANAPKLEVKTLRNFKGELPKYESKLASGMDVRAQVPADVEIGAGERTTIPTGLAFKIPQGYEIQVRPRSGLAARDGISVINTPGTIDADYRGEVKIAIVNHGKKKYVIRDQERIAQLVVAPVVQMKMKKVNSLEKTKRGSGGFGSTGKK